MLSFSSTNTAKCFYLRLLFIHSLLSLYLCLELPQPRYSTLHLALLNLVRDSPLKPVQLLQDGISSLQQADHRVSSTNLLRVYLVSLSIVPAKLLNRSSANTHPWGHHLSLISIWILSHWQQLSRVQASSQCHTYPVPAPSVMCMSLGWRQGFQTQHCQMLWHLAFSCWKQVMFLQKQKFQSCLSKNFFVYKCFHYISEFSMP